MAVAFCIDMHTKARRAGETEQRYALNAWRDTPERNVPNGNLTEEVTNQQPCKR